MRAINSTDIVFEEGRELAVGFKVYRELEEVIRRNHECSVDVFA